MRVKRNTFAAQSVRDDAMKRLKDETLSIRTSADIKRLLRLAAEKEHRSIASMMEVLILNYAEKYGLKAEAPESGGESDE